MRKVHTRHGGDHLPSRPSHPVNPATEPSAGRRRPSLAEARTRRPASTRQGQRKASRRPGKPREPVNPATEPSAGAVGQARPKPKLDVQRPRVRGSAKYQGALAIRTEARPTNITLSRGAIDQSQLHQAEERAMTETPTSRQGCAKSPNLCR